MHRRTQQWLATVLVLACVSPNITSPIALAHATAATAVANWVDLKVGLSVADIAWDVTRNVVVAAVNPVDPRYGNEIVELDPSTGTVLRHVAVGGSPNKIAISDDGSRAYIALSANGAVARLDLAAFSIDGVFYANLGTPSSTVAQSLSVQPGNPRAVAVAWRQRCCAQRFAGLAIYDDGVPRANFNAPPGPIANSITFGSPSRLYGFNNESASFNFSTWDVDSLGLTLYRNTAELVSGIGATIQFAGTRLYVSYGLVIDPIQRIRIGDYASAAEAAAPALTTNQVFYMTANGIEEYRADNLTLTSSLPLTTPSRATTLVATSAGLAATFANGDLHLYGEALMADPIMQPTPIADHISGWEEFLLEYAASAIEHDPIHNRLIIATTAASQNEPNTVLEIDPGDGRILRRMALGYEPGAIALSDDASSLYVAHRSSDELQRIDMSSLRATATFALGDASLHVGAMAVAPNSPDTLAVVRTDPAATPNRAGVQIFDNGFPRPNIGVSPESSDSITFTDSATVLVSSIAGPLQSMTTLALDSYGASTSNSVAFLGGSAIASKIGNKILTRCGTVIDANDLTLVGAFTTQACNLTADAANDRIYDFDPATERLFEWQFSTGRLVKQQALAIGTVDIRSIVAMQVGLAIQTGTTVELVIPRPEPTLLPWMGAAVEGQSGTSNVEVPFFLVTADYSRLHASRQDIVVSWQTSDANALSGVDYDSASGTTTVRAGQTSGVVSIPIRGDTGPESDEWFLVLFTHASGAKVGGFFGIGLAGIADDD